MELFLDRSNTVLSVKNQLFQLTYRDQQKLIAPKRVSLIAITSNAQINTAAIRLALKHKIPITIFDADGSGLGSFVSSRSHRDVQLRWQQLLFMRSDYGLQWAVDQVILKGEQQLLNINRWIKAQPSLADQLSPIQSDARLLLNKIMLTDIRNKNIENTIRGFEGNLSRYYFRALNLMLPNVYRFATRSRQPGKDMFNVLLNYLYGMTYNRIEQALLTVNLDPYCGALHSTANQEALLFDMIEPFRPIIDRLLVESCQDEQWSSTEHFNPITGGMQLNSKGKKILLPLYSDYMQQRIEFQRRVDTTANHFVHHARRLKSDIQQFQGLCI